MMSPKRPIRILRIIARLNIGGPAINAINLSVHLDKYPYQTLLVCGKVGADEGDMSYLALDMGLKPLFITELGREITVLDDLKSLIQLRKVMRRFKPNIIHTHTAKAGTLGRLAGLSLNLFKSRGNRIRMVHTFHGHIFHSYFGAFKTFLFIQIERFLSRFTDQIIVLSSRQKDDICHTYKIAGPERVKIIPLGFHLSDFAETPENGGSARNRYFPNSGDEVLLVGIIGRLTHVKNHRMFLEAISYLKETGGVDPFRFFIIGDGELKRDLIHYSRELGIQEFVTFTGWEKDMSSVYRTMDIVVLTSLNEGTPVVLIEAMSAGIPIVATDVGGVRDLFGDQVDEIEGIQIAQNGILIPAGECELLAKALLFLSGNKGISKKITSHAKDFVMNTFSIERLVKDMDSLYSEMVSG
jgi:glycosyltransferase involved in cell wall biosynthesis